MIVNRNSLTDAQLVGRMVDGDGDCAALLLERYRMPVLAILRRSLDGADVEDAYQTIWLRVVRAAAGFDPALPFDRWLFQISWNVVRTEWARKGKRSAELSEEIPASAPDAEASAIAVDRKERIAAAVQQLPERMAEVILLRYFHDLTEAEAAARLGVPLGTIKSRAHTGLRKLRELLSGGWA